MRLTSYFVLIYSVATNSQAVQDNLTNTGKLRNIAQDNLSKTISPQIVVIFQALTLLWYLL